MPPEPRLQDALAQLSDELPPGRLITPEDGDEPVLWLSDDPAPIGLWATLRARHATSGLWPLLLDALDDDDDDRPWADGELDADGYSNPAEHDVETLLSEWWASNTEYEDSDPEDAEVTLPYGRDWPGLAAASEPPDPAYPDQIADECAHLLPEESTRIGLVRTDRGADALTAVGWQGPINMVDDIAKISAVLRSWEDRFGARVVGLGFATLDLSVAAPPVDADHALRVAAEHFAVCPDNVWQSDTPTLTAYAESIRGVNRWSFWWD